MPFSARRLAAALTCLALLVNAACGPSAKTFTVNLSVPAKVGEKSTIVTTSTTNLATIVKLTVGDQPPFTVNQKTQKRVVHLEAEAETLAVFANGAVQQAALTLKTFSLALDDQPGTDVLPPGTKVIAAGTADGQVSFLVDGKPAAGDVADTLRKVFEPGNPDRTDQAKFGPKHPVTAGADWPVDATLFAAQFQDEFGAASTCEGTMHLDAITGEGDQQIAAVSGSVEMHGLKAPLPDPYVTKSGDAKSRLKASVSSAHRGTDTMTMTLDFDFVSESPGPSGGRLISTIDMGGQRDTSVTYR